MNIQILKGTLLGDAYIPKLSNRNKSYKIAWEHSLDQEEYAIWKAEQSNIEYSIYRRSRFDDRTNKTYHSITIYSTGYDYKFLRDLFYKDVKTINYTLLDSLTKKAIAIWYMDDGNLYYNGNNCHLTLSVNCFSQKEKEIIIKYFSSRWNVHFKQSQKTIRITSIKEIIKFENHFLEYIPSFMKYKTLNYAKRKHKENNLSG